jgi:hypothetical protein
MPYFAIDATVLDDSRETPPAGLSIYSNPRSIAVSTPCVGGDRDNPLRHGGKISRVVFGFYILAAGRPALYRDVSYPLAMKRMLVAWLENCLPLTGESISMRL